MNKLSTPHTTVKVFEIGILNPVLGFCQGLPLPRDHQFIKKAPVYRSINEDFGLLYSHSKVFSLHSLPSLQAASKMLTLCYPSSASHFPTHPSQHHPKVVALKSKGPAGLSSRSHYRLGAFPSQRMWRQLQPRPFALGTAWYLLHLLCAWLGSLTPQYRSYDEYPRVVEEVATNSSPSQKSWTHASAASAGVPWSISQACSLFDAHPRMLGC